MFVNSDIPSGYKYVYAAGSNYIALTNVSSYESGDSLDCYYQYLEPSWLYVHTYATTSSEGRCRELTDISTSDYARADFPEIFITGMVLLFFILWLINSMTRMIHKGGIFFGA